MLCTPRMYTLLPRFGFLCHNSRLRMLSHLRRRRICRAGVLRLMVRGPCLRCGGPAGGSCLRWRWCGFMVGFSVQAVQAVQVVQGKLYRAAREARWINYPPDVRQGRQGHTALQQAGHMVHEAGMMKGRRRTLRRGCFLRRRCAPGAGGQSIGGRCAVGHGAIMQAA